MRFRVIARAGTRLAVAVLASAVTTVSARAYSLEGPAWPNATTKLAGQIPHADFYSDALGQAAADWNATGRFKFSIVKRSADPCSKTGLNGADFASTACGRAFGSTTLAVTMYRYSADKRFTHFGTIFNTSKTFNVYSGLLERKVMDFRRVAVHELGHGLGLAHADPSGRAAIMKPTIGNVEKPTADDIAGVTALYR